MEINLCGVFAKCTEQSLKMKNEYFYSQKGLTCKEKNKNHCFSGFFAA